MVRRLSAGTNIRSRPRWRLLSSCTRTPPQDADLTRAPSASPSRSCSLANVSGWSSAWTRRRAERCRPFEAKARATQQIASAVRASRQRGPAWSVRSPSGLASPSQNFRFPNGIHCLARPGCLAFAPNGRQPRLLMPRQSRRAVVMAYLHEAGRDDVIAPSVEIEEAGIAVVAQALLVSPSGI